MNLLRRETGKILVESHRGAENIAPENSWAGILAGAEAGADLIEVDVQITSDHVPVIYHHYRLPHGSFLHATPSSQLDVLDMGDGQPPPHLDDVLAWLKHQSVGMTLDIKSGFGMGIRTFAPVLEAIKKADVVEQVMLASWDHIGLLWSKRHLPTITTRALLRGIPLDLIAIAKRAEVDAISMAYDLISPADVEALHEADIAVMLSGLWEPNFRYPVQLGVDFISWGDPAEAIFALEMQGARG